MIIIGQQEEDENYLMNRRLIQFTGDGKDDWIKWFPILLWRSLKTVWSPQSQGNPNREMFIDELVMFKYWGFMDSMAFWTMNNVIKFGKEIELSIHVLSLKPANWKFVVCC